MQENKDRDYSTDPSQVSESGEGDSPSVFLNGSKLRTKLEKLARWRIDPSLIEFPKDTPEFRGGYATVLRAFLASSFSTEAIRSENEPKHTTDECPDPDPDKPHSLNDTQGRKVDQQDKDEEADSRTADKDLTEEKGRKASDTQEQPESFRSTFTPKVDDGPESSNLPAREDLNSEYRDARPQRDTQDPGDDPQSRDEGIDSRTVDGDNDETQAEGGDSTKHENQKSHPQASVLTLEDGSGSSEHTADRNLGSGSPSAQLQSDTQERGDDQQHNDEGPGGPIAYVENAQIKEGQKSDRETSEPKIVAVKKLKVEEDTDSKRVLGLALRESEFLVGLSHPNIVKFEGFVEDLSTQKVWLIFPWEEHGNLRDFLASGEWEIPERISLINDVTLGLEYLHSQEPPIYHGDLKSLNILVSSECQALITDFGSARHLGSDHVSKQPKENNRKPRPATASNPDEEHITLGALFSATATTLTLTGSSYTLRWAAPELLQEDKPCLRSDIWALGWIAYEVMTNTIPFHDVKKDAIVINRVIQGQLPSVTEDARMSLIRALCSLMVRCWSIDPDKRPTAEECRKLISWMPMIVPAPTEGMNEAASQLRHARLLNELGHMYRRQADYSSALDCFNKALDIYGSHNNTSGRAETLRYLADAHRFRNEYTEAVTFYSQALEILTELSDETGRAYAMFGLAETHRFRGDYGEAVKFYSECLRIHTNAGSKRERATALWGLAEVHKRRGEYSEAISLYSQALPIFTDVGDDRVRALTLWGLAGVHRFREEYSEAISLYSEALRIYNDVGDRKESALTLWDLATAHRSQSQYSEAGKLYSESLQLYTDIGDSHGRGCGLWGLAEVHRAVQEYDEATQFYSEALQIFTDIGDKNWRADTLISYAESNKLQGHLNEAISLYTEASEVLEDIGDTSGASDALERAADIRKTL